MIQKCRQAHRNRGLAAVVFALVLIFGLVCVLTPTQAQSPAKKVLTVDDYTRWRSISGQEISGDGKWVTYGLSFTNTLPADAKPVCTCSISKPIRTWRSRTRPGGLSPPTHAGSPTRSIRAAAAAAAAAAARRRLAPAKHRGSAAGAQGRGAGSEAPTPPQRVELRNLATGAVQSWQDIESFTFSANSSHLILRRRPAAAAAGAQAARCGARRGGQAAPARPAAPAGPRGVDVILHNLTTGRYQLLGSVGDIAFNKAGDLLAYTVDAALKDSNGLFVLDLRNGRVNALDNDAKNYNRLTWSEDGTALAVLKGLDVEKMRERDNVLLAFPNVQAALGADPPGLR